MAVLIDLDNIRPRLETVEQLCRKHGRLVERRAFSNTPSVLAAYGGAFRQFGYRFELTPGLDPVPQEVDQLLERTALELVGSPNLKLQSVAIVSNDNDYAELLEILKRRGLKTVVLANQPGKQLIERADVVESLGEVLRAIPLGIDLGTTNTVIAHATQSLGRRWNAQQLEVTLPDGQGALCRGALIPSSVRFSADGVQLGETVRTQYHAYRSSTVLAWKDDIGRSRDDVPFQYELSAARPRQGSVSAEYMQEYFNSGRVAPEEAAAAVLSFCRENTEMLFPGRVKGVVITHPASYESDAIEATRRAACLAGWSEDDVVLLSEPHAALYHFLHQLQQGDLGEVLDVRHARTLAVYDLGGGTLDVSLHTVRWDDDRQRFDVQDLAIGSRTRVGGNRIDRLLVDYVLGRAPIPTLAPAEREQLEAEMLIYAERFKKVWGAEYESSQEGCRVNFQGAFLAGRVPIRCPIDVSTMRTILAPLLCEDLELDLVEEVDINEAFDLTPFTDRLDTLVVPVLELLLKARRRLGQVPTVEGVLLNGGMTYFPLVRERLERLLGPQTLLLHSNPDYAVARGAALYAAGVQGQAAKRINPTDISLEVQGRSGKALEKLVAQGQAFPYRTLIRGLRVPAAQDGELSFPIWVGMGSQPGRGNTMQRFRAVPLREVEEAGLHPGSAVDLEVEYGFDERLTLTLIHPTLTDLRFPLEVGRGRRARSGPSDESGRLRSPGQPCVHLPAVQRTRVTVPQRSLGAASQGSPGPIRFEGDLSVGVEAGEWLRLAEDLGRFPSDGGLWERFRRLEAQTVAAPNRAQVAATLVQELTRCSCDCWGKASVLLRGARSVLSRIAPSHPEIRKTEDKLQTWLGSRLRELDRLHPSLAQEMAETPGKLLWTGWGSRLVNEHLHYGRHAWSVTLLNSVGKCAQADEPTLDYLYEVISTHQAHPQREKAAWALGRLLAPGQPEPYRADPDLAFAYLPRLLNRLKRERHIPVLPSLVGALFQIASRHLIGEEIPEKLHHVLLNVHWNDPKETRYPDIRRFLRVRLEDLRSMLNLSAATPEATRRIQEYLLELSRD